MLIIRVFASKDWFACNDVNYKAVVVKDFNPSRLLSKTTL